MEVKNCRMDRQFAMYKNEYMERIESILDGGQYVLGEQMHAFEKEYAEMNGSEYCVACANCLDALTMAFSVVKEEKPYGDEVLVPANTFIASVMGITKNGLKPVFVDPDKYYNIDADVLEEKITDKTIAICVVHLYGQLCDMEKIMGIAKKHNLMVVEDCAQAHGANLNGKMAGTFGDIGCFSFYPTKNLGAFGDAGCLLTNNKKYADKFTCMRNYGSFVTYHFDIVGMNSRMDEIHAGVLRIKMKHYGELIEERRKIASRYLNEIKNDLIVLPETHYDSNTHVYYLFVVRVEERDRFISYCKENGVNIAVHYPIPPHLSKCYLDLGYSEGSLPVAEKFAKTVASLPMYNGMSEDEITYVINVINNYK